jgi:hypothetical protein
MLPFGLFLTFASVYTTVIASPAQLTAWDLLRANQKFSLEQVAVERKSPWSHELRRVYLKYGHKPPSYIEEAIKYYDSIAALPMNSENTTASVGTKPLFADLEYVIDVKIGNLNLSLNLDTGSADL